MKFLKIIVVFSILFTLFGCEPKEEVFLNGEVSLIHEVNTEYVDQGITIPEGYTAVVEGTVNVTVLGQNILKYTILDNEGVTIKTFTRVVNIIDTIAPTFDPIETLDLEVYEFSDINWESYVKELNDNSNLEITLTIEEDVDFDTLGTYTVLIKATDTSYNEFSRTFNVNVVDTTAPTVIFDTNFIYVFNVSDPKKIINEVTDNYYDKNQLVVSNNLDDIIGRNETGLHEITYTVSDPSGNTIIENVEIEFVSDLYSLFEKLFIDNSDVIVSGYKNDFPDGSYYYWLNLENQNSISITDSNRITFRYKLSTIYGDGHLSISSDFGSYNESTIGIHVGSGINNYTTAFLHFFNILSNNPSTNNTFQVYSLNYLNIPKAEAESFLNDNLLSAIEAFVSLMENLGIQLD